MNRKENVHHSISAYRRVTLKSRMFPGPSSHLAFSTDGNYLATHAYRTSKRPDGLIVFRTKTGEEAARYDFGEPTFFPKLSFLKDGKTVAVSCGDKLTLISLVTGKKLATVGTE